MAKTMTVMAVIVVLIDMSSGELKTNYIKT